MPARVHPAEGARIARPLRKWLGPWSLAIAQHHERWDGSGYPRGLSGSHISRAARIVAVADAFDVMTAARSYRPAVRPDAARQELAACAGRDFDPQVVRAFLDISLGSLRWAVGIGGLLALPLMPRHVTQPARNTAARGLAAVAALAAGVLPLQATPATQVLGERGHHDHHRSHVSIRHRLGDDDHADPDYAGPDSFGYSVCDTTASASPRRCR